MGSPSVKEDWVVEHRLSRLALHPSNSPSWDLAPAHHTQAHTHKLPLFVKTVLAHKVSTASHYLMSWKICRSKCFHCP